MWENEVIPRLAPFTGGLIFTRILRVWGLGESAVEERLGSVIHSNNPTVATYAKSDAIDVRITAKAETREQAEHAGGRNGDASTADSWTLYFRSGQRYVAKRNR